MPSADHNHPLELDRDESVPVGAISDDLPSGPTTLTIFADALDEFDDLDCKSAFSPMSHSSEAAPLSVPVSSRPILLLPVPLPLSRFSAATVMHDGADQVPPPEPMTPASETARHLQPIVTSCDKTVLPAMSEPIFLAKSFLVSGALRHNNKT